MSERDEPGTYVVKWECSYCDSRGYQWVKLGEAAIHDCPDTNMGQAFTICARPVEPDPRFKS